ncbi:hypothetical protein BDZ45DRAFT_695896 [Acephala macrosclerotiorum]|nr:hypothetical protein BDZ45DRAFT_695896 [Acephala macrosclerotiorum]
MGNGLCRMCKKFTTLRPEPNARKSSGLSMRRATDNMNDRASADVSKDAAKSRASLLEKQACKMDKENAQPSQRSPDTENGKKKQKSEPPIFSPEVSRLKGNGKTNEKVESEYVSLDHLDEDLNLVELWALADELQMPRLQNLAIKAINDIGEKLDSIAILTIELAYEPKAVDSFLQRYLVATRLTNLNHLIIGVSRRIPQENADRSSRVSGGFRYFFIRGHFRLLCGRRGWSKSLDMNSLNSLNIDPTPAANSAGEAENAPLAETNLSREHVAKKQRHDSLPSREYSLLEASSSVLIDPSDPGGIVKLLVGGRKKPTEFIVHKEMACYNSPVFKAAFDAPVNGDRCQVYKLPHIDKETARLLLQWLYTKELMVKGLEDGPLPEETCDEETYALVKLWLLAEELQIPRLQNKALEVIDDVSAKTKYIATGSIPTIYNKTKEGSALRRYMVSACYHCLEGKIYKDCKEHFPTEMMLNLAVFVAVDSQEGGNFDLSNYFVDVGED